jgi:quinol monooxygenase YgiN
MRAVIDDAAGVFTLLNTFTVAPDRQEDVIRSLMRFTAAHARLQSGFVATSVHASLDGHRVVNYVQWRSQADLAAMMASPEAQAHMAEVTALAARIDPVIYRVAYVGSFERAAE